MSTYLLAFIVSDFVSIESRQNHLLVRNFPFVLHCCSMSDTILDTVALISLQIRIWGRKKAINNGQGEYALNVTGPILQFYERYYNASYPLSKSGMLTQNLFK